MYISVIDEKYKKLNSEQNVDNVESSSASDKAQSFVLLPFINKNLAQKAKNLFHALNIKVSFCTSRSLNSAVRPRESSIDGKYG